MRKISIIRYGDGELANQLWNYVSIYAFALETKSIVSNPSFYEYHSSFKLLKNEDILIRLLSKLFENNNKRKNSFLKQFWRKMYRIYSILTIKLVKGELISSESTENKTVYLLPSPQSIKIDQNRTEKLYFSGWLFRNPIGLEKYRRELTIAFSPNEKITDRVHEIIKVLSLKYEKIIGIHIRQGDYKRFKGGKYFIKEKRMVEIIHEYIRINGLMKDKIVFVITSDGPIDENNFKDLNIYISKEDAISDLFLLSATDLIIGSDSTFGDFSAWYGNIPHIIATNEDIDWTYYNSRNKFFENKYCTMVHY